MQWYKNRFRLWIIWLTESKMSSPISAYLATPPEPRLKTWQRRKSSNERLSLWKSAARGQRTKHSAASSIRPSWKRCSSLKVSARALRRLSEGSTRSLLCWNWLKMLWRQTRRAKTKQKGFKLKLDAVLKTQTSLRLRVQALAHRPLKRRRCRHRQDRSDLRDASNFSWKCPAARAPVDAHADEHKDENQTYLKSLQAAVVRGKCLFKFLLQHCRS